MTAPLCSVGLLVVALKGLSPWIRYPLALVLSAKRVGDEADFEMSGQKKRYRIDQIAKYKTA